MLISHVKKQVYISLNTDAASFSSEFAKMKAQKIEKMFSEWKKPGPWNVLKEVSDLGLLEPEECKNVIGFLQQEEHKIYFLMYLAEDPVLLEKNGEIIKTELEKIISEKKSQKPLSINLIILQIKTKLLNHI